MDKYGHNQRKDLLYYRSSYPWNTSGRPQDNTAWRNSSPEKEHNVGKTVI